MPESVFMPTFARTGITLERGQGSTLWDDQGRRYIDFYAGIAVSSLGHGHPLLSQAIAAQAAKLIHVCNYYQTAPANRFAERLCQACGMSAVFLANSGCEANEGAIKLARKYSSDSHAGARTRILSLGGSFHGRTITTLAATGQDGFHRHFGPFTPGFGYLPANDLAALEAELAKGDVVAFMLEPIQGEGGVIPIEANYLRSAAKACAAHDVLLIVDEIQTGMGRTGSFLYSQALGVQADIVTLAKGIAGGVPCGALLCGPKLANVFGPGDHGTTFGGNPLAAAAGLVVLDELEREGFMAEVERKGRRIRQGLESFGSPLLGQVRGAGLMIGVPLACDPHLVMERALRAGCLVLCAGKDVLRILPPLTISDAEIDEGLEILRGVFAALDKE